ncbi:TadE/TadG family type IV pilus assembly protein [Pseudaminobacter soli (ex Li et al. 2025)]|uniref:Pilus assembly protein n=1 Tax=Pseudaminobacter soli (ex Li et al. 2025) TaxID=1295366 RepID=A0A2P7S5E5_9HYPH|nr:TadE/TadG family type IV pilus assembly protein [Mesorhizobium soli]PSJ57672.1 pilus assembly protein [Mesorhizobium soli]
MFGALRHIAGCFNRDKRGTALVEMALVAPLMIILSAGVFEFGNMLHQKLLMQAGLNDAARFAARCNSQMYTDYNLPAINCANIAKNIAVYGVTGDPTPASQPRVAGWSKNDVTVEIASPLGCHDAIVAGVTKYRSVTAQVCIVRVTNSKVYRDLGMLSVINIGPITLGGTHEERLIRF